MSKYQKSEEVKSKYPFWVIINRKKGSVWIGDRESPMFLTEADAMRELNFQTTAMKPGMKTNYKIERFDNPNGWAERREESKRNEIESLEQFARQFLPYKDN